MLQFIIILLIIFAMLIVVLRVFSNRFLNTALNKLNVLHEENLGKEAQLTEELKIAKEEARAEIKRGQEAARVIIEEAKAEAMKARLVMEEEARKRVEKIINDGKEDALKYKELAEKEARDTALDLSVKLIEQFFTDKDKSALQHELLDEVIRAVGELEKDKFGISADKVKIISSFEMDSSQREKLEKALGGKLGYLPVFEETINSGLIGGLIIEMGGFMIDGSLKNKLSKACKL